MFAQHPKSRLKSAICKTLDIINFAAGTRLLGFKPDFFVKFNNWFLVNNLKSLAINTKFYDCWEFVKILN